MTTAREGPEHVSGRPHWDCKICNQPWPCASARADLRAEFNAFPMVLILYLSSQMYDAIGDFTSAGVAPPANLYDRFLTWAQEVLS